MELMGAVRSRQLKFFWTCAKRGGGAGEYDDDGNGRGD